MADPIEAQAEEANRSEFANQSEVPRNDRVLLETPAGTVAEKDPAEESLLDAEVKGMATARPTSDVTGVSDAGTDEETPDGLTSSEEALRTAAEDSPVGDGDAAPDDGPVFDRHDAPPRI